MTSQVVDLQARIANLRASETALQGIAAKATKISDVLEVQAQLTADARPDRDAHGAAEGSQRPRRLRHADGPVQRPGPRRRGRPEGLGSRVRGRRGRGLDGLGPPGPGDRRDLVRHRVAADPADRRPRGRHRGRDRAAARVRPSDAGWICRPHRSSARASARTARVGATRRVAVARCRGDRPGRTLRPDRRGLRALVGAGPGAGRRRAPRRGGAGHRRGAERLLDIGTGTGQLALGAVESLAGRLGRRGRRLGRDGARWPTPRPTACCQAPIAGGSGRSSRSPTRLPFADGAFDAALSSFVFQLVPNRARALREARRVLRPGGMLAYVTWLDDERVVRARRDLRRGARRPRVRRRATATADPATSRRSSARRASCGGPGSRTSTARGGLLEHRFTVDGYIAFLTEFDEESLFAELEPDAARTAGRDAPRRA